MEKTANPIQSRSEFTISSSLGRPITTTISKEFEAKGDGRCVEPIGEGNKEEADD